MRTSLVPALTATQRVRACACARALPLFSGAPSGSTMNSILGERGAVARRTPFLAPTLPSLLSPDLLLRVYLSPFHLTRSPCYVTYAIWVSPCAGGRGVLG